MFGLRLARLSPGRLCIPLLYIPDKGLNSSEKKKEEKNANFRILIIYDRKYGKVHSYH